MCYRGNIIVSEIRNENIITDIRHLIRGNFHMKKGSQMNEILAS